MFGLVQPCRHDLPGDLFTQWQAHLCGLCLALRDGHGQAARLTTNTDAVLISVLTAAQQAGPEAIAGAGACPLRGMRSAVVVDAHSPGVELAATASLTLAATKAHDMLAEQRHGLAPRARSKTAVARRAAGRLERRARSGNTPLDVDAIVQTLAGQAELESSGAELGSLTEPTARACARVFAATADSAGRPENSAALAEIGFAYGRIAHLLDAVEDLDRDGRTGAFNPLAATGTPARQALDDCRRLASAIGTAYRRLVLHDDRLLRVVLLDGLRRAIHRRAAGERASIPPPERFPRPEPFPAPGRFVPPGARPGSPAHRPPPSGPPRTPPPPRGGAGGGRGDEPDDSGAPDPGGPSLPGGWPAVPPAEWPEKWPYPPPFPKNRSFGERVMPFLGVSCLGPACCTRHWNHCTDKYKAPCYEECCQACDCCDCCDCCCCDT